MLVDHTPNTSHLFQVGGRNQIMTPRGHFLQYDFRRILQDDLGLGSQGVGKQHDGGEHKHNQRVDQQQAQVLSWTSLERCQREINQISLFLNRWVHLISELWLEAKPGSRWENVQRRRGGPGKQCADLPV